MEGELITVIGCIYFQTKKLNNQNKPITKTQ